MILDDPTNTPKLYTPSELLAQVTTTTKKPSQKSKKKEKEQSK